MKTQMKIKGRKEQRPQQQKKKGVALLTVLTVMSLATILVLTFFTMAQTELESATSYAQGMEAKHLSETAVNMVIGQIRKATTNYGSTKRNYAWASQPGAIRTYAPNGTMSNGFKLYSDDKMVETQEAALAVQDANELSAWNSNTSVFVDLNEPVIRGNKVFYPIVDPRAKTLQQIEGFDYNTAAVGQSPLAGAIRRADGQADSLPMPVKWLYQLEDGSMGYLSSGNQFVPIGGASPTVQNPIVGRVAFWTDDETTKLNVNTAAGGMVWDTPRTGGDIDRNFGRYQPAQKEWQRYPGHPATTSLSPVFFPNKPDIVFNRKAMDMLYQLTPRVVGGGSRAGSVKASEPNGLVADKDRLYASLDEFIMRPDRTENQFPTEFMKGGGAAALLARSSFFLTATSRAPEVTLFNTPRVSIWPTYNKKSSSDEKYTTPFDDLIRFTAELGVNSGGGYAKGFQYYFQRENADSPTVDYANIRRNKEIYAYLDTLMETNIPGFGGNFAAKYGNQNQNQLLTEIFDYIRSTNLFDDTIYPNYKDVFTANNGSDHLTYTNYRLNDKNTRGIHMGHGQVTPININYQGIGTKGFGRFYTIVEVGIQLICCADGSPNAFNASGGQGGGEANNNDRFQTNVFGGGGKNGVPYPAMGIQAYSNFPLGATGPGPEGQAQNQSRMLTLANGGNPLNTGEKIVQAALLFKVFSPSQGWVPINPDFKFTVSGAGGITVGGNSGLFPNVATWKANGVPFTGVWSGRHYGGNGGFRSLMRSNKKIDGSWARVSPADSASDADYNTYHWISKPFKVSGNTLALSAGDLEITIYSNADDTSVPSSPQSPSELVQTMVVKMGSLNGNMPTPSLSPGRREYINEFGVIAPPESSPGAFWSLSRDGAFPNGVDSANRGRLYNVTRSPYYGARFIKEGDTVWSMGVPHGDYRLIAARQNAGSLFQPHPYALKGERMAHTFYTAWGNYWGFAGSGRHAGSDKVDSAVELVQIKESRGHSPTPLWEPSTQWNLYGDFDNGMGNAQDGPYINKADEGNTHSLNRPAPGSVPKTAYDMRRDYGDFPYFVREYIHEPGGPSYFSPNRIMPGPGVFGSLPTAALTSTGTNTSGAWQTLLFRPDISGSGYSPHPGALSPKDHLIMDLFWMPVVEPYAISETLSTAGKVNMNYQILPFSYIKRRTALHGVFMSEVMMTVPNKHARDYKSGSGRGFGYHWKYSPYGGTLQQRSMRTFIVPDKTLDQFETNKFAQNQIFKSATEICDIFLVAKDIGEASGYSNQAGTYTPTVQQMRSGKYNRDHAVVGDNGRERPYTDIYPRLTTKSNTYKVHFRAQVLRKAKGQSPSRWDPLYDQVVGEYRGSTVIERYIDPNDPDIPDYATTPGAPPLDSFYRYRVLNTRRFAP